MQDAELYKYDRFFAVQLLRAVTEGSKQGNPFKTKELASYLKVPYQSLVSSKSIRCKTIMYLMQQQWIKRTSSRGAYLPLKPIEEAEAHFIKWSRPDKKIDDHSSEVLQTKTIPMGDIKIKEAKEIELKLSECTITIRFNVIN